MESPSSPYQPHKYPPSEGTTWYHYIYGYVPNHQLDFFCRPSVPGDILPQHFSHLNRLIQYIEPFDGSAVAFAICNLSRDDTQHEPGHGGLALVFGFRASGATDHAGRPNPPFTHSVVAVDRQFSEQAICDAALAFYKTFVGKDGESAQDWFKSILCSRERMLDGLPAYLARYNSLPSLPKSTLRGTLTSTDSSTRRIVITHGENVPFEDVIAAASRAAALLYCSNIKWTAIFVGQDRRGVDGVSVHFVSASDPTLPRTSLPPQVSIDDVANAKIMARQLNARSLVDDDPVVTLTDTNLDESDIIGINAETDPVGPTLGSNRASDGVRDSPAYRGVLIFSFLGMALVVGLLLALFVHPSDSHDHRGPTDSPPPSNSAQRPIQPKPVDKVGPAESPDKGTPPPDNKKAKPVPPGPGKGSGGAKNPPRKSDIIRDVPF